MNEKKPSDILRRNNTVKVKTARRAVCAACARSAPIILIAPHNIPRVTHLAACLGFGAASQADAGCALEQKEGRLDTQSAAKKKKKKQVRGRSVYSAQHENHPCLREWEKMRALGEAGARTASAPALRQGAFSE